MPTYVPYEGPVSARLALIGEAPGKDEVIEMRPFVGLAGKRLMRLLNSFGILREEVRLMNVSRVRPRNNNFDLFWQNAKPKNTIPSDFLLSELQLLKKSIAEMLNLEVIVTLGRQPTFLLTGKDGIFNMRGSVLRLNTRFPTVGVMPETKTQYYEEFACGKIVTLIPTLHPSFINSMPEFTWPVLADLTKVNRILKDGYKPKQQVMNVYPTVEDIRQFYSLMSEINKPLSVDIETRNNRITRIGMCYNLDYAISIPFWNINTGENMNNDWAWELIRDLLDKLPVIGQNFGSYDIPWLLKKHNCPVRNFVFDTMAAQHVILPGLPKPLKPLGLGFLTSVYTDGEYYKDEAKDQDKKPPPDNEYGEYNCKDVLYTLETMQKQQQQTNFKRRKATFDFEMKVVNTIIRDVMARGIRINVDKKRAMLNRANLECEYLAMELCNMIGRSINIASPDQLRDVLFGELKLKSVGRKTPAGKPSTDEDSLLILGAIYPDVKELQIILQFREVEQLRKGILSAEISEDGRMYSSYRQATDTGRLSSTKSAFRDGYPLHTVPRRSDVRRLYIPDEGKLWVSRDLSQAEAWITYCLADAKRMIGEMRNGKKPHQLMAARMSGKRYRESGKGTKEYALGKKTVHSCNYMISPREHVRGVRKELGINISETEAKRHINMYYSMVPEVPTWHMSTYQRMRNNHMILKTPFGRERKFFGRMGTNLTAGREVMKKAVAFLPQSTVGDLLNIIILRWYEIRTVGEFLGPVHDETNTQCLPCELEQHLKELDEAFNYAFDIGIYKNMVIPWETEVKHSWGGPEYVKR